MIPKGYLITLSLFLLFFMILGLLREYVFININNIIYFKYYKQTSIPIPFAFGGLTKFSFAELYYLKYPLTLVFVAVYYASNRFFLKQFQVSDWYIQLLNIAYFCLLFISALLMLYAYLFHQKLNHDEYSISISLGLMRLAQSPLIGFVLFVVSLWDKNKLHHYEKRNPDL